MAVGRCQRLGCEPAPAPCNVAWLANLAGAEACDCYSCRFRSLAPLPPEPPGHARLHCRSLQVIATLHRRRAPATGTALET